MSVFSLLGQGYGMGAEYEQQSCKQASLKLRSQFNEYMEKLSIEDKGLGGSLPVMLRPEVSLANNVYPNARYSLENGVTTVYAAPRPESGNGKVSHSRARHYEWKVASNINELERSQQMLSYKMVPAEATAITAVKDRDKTSLGIYESALLDVLYQRYDRICVVNPSNGTLYRLQGRPFVVICTDVHWRGHYETFYETDGINCIIVDTFDGMHYLGSNGYNRDYAQWCALTPSFVSANMPYNNYSVADVVGGVSISYEKKGVMRDFFFPSLPTWNRYSPQQVDDWLKVVGCCFFFETSESFAVRTVDKKGIPCFYLDSGPYTTAVVGDYTCYVRNNVVLDIVGGAGTSMARRHWLGRYVVQYGYELAPLRQQGSMGFSWTSSELMGSDVYMTDDTCSEVGRITFTSQLTQTGNHMSVVVITREGVGRKVPFLPGLVLRDVPAIKSDYSFNTLPVDRRCYVCLSDAHAALSQLKILEWFYYDGASMAYYEDSLTTTVSVDDVLESYRAQPLLTDVAMLDHVKYLSADYDRGSTGRPLRSALYGNTSFIVSAFEINEVTMTALQQLLETGQETIDFLDHMKGRVWCYPVDKFAIGGSVVGNVGRLLKDQLSSPTMRCRDVIHARVVQVLSYLFWSRYISVESDPSGYYVVRARSTISAVT